MSPIIYFIIFYIVYTTFYTDALNTNAPMTKTMLQIKKTMILELPVISLKTKIPSNPVIRSPHWFIGPATANPIAGIAKICMILPMSVF